MLKDNSKKVTATIILALLVLFAIIVYGTVDASISAVNIANLTAVNTASANRVIVEEAEVPLSSGPVTISEEYTLSTPLSDFTRIIVNTLVEREGQLPNAGAIYLAEDMTNEDISYMLRYAAVNNGAYFFAKEAESGIAITTSTADDFVTLNMGVSLNRIEDIYSGVGTRDGATIDIKGSANPKVYVKLGDHISREGVITEEITILNASTGEERSGQITFEKLDEWSNVFNYRFVSIEFK